MQEELRHAPLPKYLKQPRNFNECNQSSQLQIHIPILHTPMERPQRSTTKKTFDLMKVKKDMLQTFAKQLSTWLLQISRKH
jgi:hypothetical protein